MNFFLFFFFPFEICNIAKYFDATFYRVVSSHESMVLISNELMSCRIDPRQLVHVTTIINHQRWKVNKGKIVTVSFSVHVPLRDPLIRHLPSALLKQNDHRFFCFILFSCFFLGFFFYIGAKFYGYCVSVGCVCDIWYTVTIRVRRLTYKETW